VYRSSCEYVAECIDLDLIVKDQTLEGALHGLQHAMIGHLKVALEGDITGLIPRPSPLSRRLRYYYLCAKAGLLGGSRGDFRVQHSSCDQLLSGCAA
jgi:hypothetical protein